MCEERWKVLKEKYEIDENGQSWLSVMYNSREHWIDAYLKDTFWAGMTSSQRSESINSFFDGYVNARTQLVDFIHQYDKAIADRRSCECREDFMNLNCSPIMCLLDHPLEVQAGKLYTRTILKFFQEELIAGLSLYHDDMQVDGSKKVYQICQNGVEKGKVDVVSYDPDITCPFSCTCAMIVTHGYLYRHIIHVMTQNQIRSIPQSYVVFRWTLDARSRNNGYSNVMNMRNNSNIQCGIIRLWALRAKFNDTLELVSESDSYMAKLESVLENLHLEAEKEIKPNEVHIQDSCIGSQVGSNAPVILRDGEEIFVRDPDGPAKTKGRPKLPSRLLRPSEQVKKKRKCGNCQQLGHYKTSCPIMVSKFKLFSSLFNFAYFLFL
jgi:hypothetical protein